MRTSAERFVAVLEKVSGFLHGPYGGPILDYVLAVIAVSALAFMCIGLATNMRW